MCYPTAVMLRAFSFVILLCATVAADANRSGVVVAISDGDTLTVVIDEKTVKVRLVDIDAPESRQPFGTRSKQSLSSLCLQRTAKLEEHGKDRYSRTIARVFCDDQDAGAEQVRRGMAWVFDHYAPPSSPLYALQEDARTARRGLWADTRAVPPWEWRRDRAR